MKPVITTTDGSEHSLRVVPHAFSLAQTLGSELKLLRVLEDDDVNEEPNESKAAATERARARLSQEMDAALKRAGATGSVEVAEVLEGEKPVDALLRLSSDGEVLAMHSRGRGSIAHLLQGSVALGVLGHVELPVLLGGPELQAPPAGGGRYRLLVTSDLSPASKEVLGAISSLIATNGFDVTLLYVHEHAPGGHDNEAEMKQHEAELQAIRSLLPASANVDVSIYQIATGGGVDTAILEQARELNANAIAMSTHGHSARRHLLMGSVALSILGRSPLPLLVSKA